MTAPQYTCMLYNTAGNGEDEKKFDAVFTNRMSYTESIKDEVRVWVAENLEQWEEDQPEWFKIEKIPDDLLPVEVLEAEGGTNRRKMMNNFSIRSLMGLFPADEEQLELSTSR